MHAAARPSDDDLAIGRRTAARLRTRLPARLDTLSGSQPADLVNLSSGGAMVVVRQVPKQGSDAILKYGDADIFCSVAWTDGERCGLMFEDELSDTDVIAARIRSDQQPNTELEERLHAARTWATGASSEGGRLGFASRS